MKQFFSTLYFKVQYQAHIRENFQIFPSNTFAVTKIKTITFLNSILFKNRFLENYAYHIEIKNTYQIFFNKEQKKY